MTRTLTSNPFSRAGLPVLAAAALVDDRGMQPKQRAAAAPAMPPPLVTVVKATAQDVPKYLDEQNIYVVLPQNVGHSHVAFPQEGRWANPSSIYCKALWTSWSFRHWQ
jgi:hypothetical protein